MSQSPYGSFSYILYYRPQGSIGCDRAISIIEANPYLKKEVLRQDINNFSEKPPWMKAIPILAQISTKEVWVGTPALAQLQYLSGMYPSTNMMKQPWQNYQTNLSLPTPIVQPNSSPETFINNTNNNNNNSLPTPQLTTTPSLPNIPQLANTPSLPNIPQFANTPPPNILPPTINNNSSSSSSFPTPAIIPTLAPQPSLPNAPQIFPPLNTPAPSNGEKKDPNRVQPLPAPDDQRQPQTLVLPPPPKKVKTEPSPQLPQPPNTNSNTSTSTSLPPTQSLLPPPPQSLSTSANMSNNNNDENSTTSQMNRNVQVNFVEAGDLPIVESPSNSNGIFSDDELVKIQSVLSKPKTINKRKGGNKKGSEKTTNTAHFERDLPTENHVEIINNLPLITETIVTENNTESS